MRTTHSFRNGAFALAAAGAVALGACSDDPVGLEEHAEPEGVELEMDGAVVATYDGSTWTGDLELVQGDETAIVTVRFVDHDGEAIVPDEDSYLEVEIGDETVAEFVQDTPGAFSGRFHGIAAGDTYAVVRLMHGAVGTGHPDFATVTEEDGDPLLVRVTVPAT